MGGGDEVTVVVGRRLQDVRVLKVYYKVTIGNNYPGKELRDSKYSSFEAIQKFKKHHAQLQLNVWILYSV